MRVTKTLAIVFAVVLVVVCFNAPVVNSWEGSRDHPWEGDDGGRDDGGDNIGIDTTASPGELITFKIAQPDNDGGSVSGYGTFVVAVRLLLVYHDIPGFYAEVLGAFGANANSGVHK
jgi:hypothetical protein